MKRNEKIYRAEAFITKLASVSNEVYQSVWVMIIKGEALCIYYELNEIWRDDIIALKD